MKLFYQATIIFFKKKETLTQNIEEVKSQLNENKKRLEIIINDISKIQIIKKSFLLIQMLIKELLNKTLEIIFLFYSFLHQIL